MQEPLIDLPGANQSQGYRPLASIAPRLAIARNL